MRLNHDTRGFSLVEVATSIGVIAFALVALLGVFPLGLENSRLCVADTRATQIVKMIGATLETETFTAADCFGNAATTLPKVDFTNLGSSTTLLSANPDLVLYASYDVTALPRVVRASSAPLDAIYRVELRFRKETFVPVPTAPTVAGVAPPVLGTNVNIRVAGLRDKKPFSESWIYLPNITRP